MESAVNRHLDLLGKRGRDKVTGITGVLTCVCFDLYGCVQVTINPGTKADGTLNEPTWFDVSRIEVLTESRVMSVPDFDKGYIAEGNKGPESKPVPLQA